MPGRGGGGGVHRADRAGAGAAVAGEVLSEERERALRVHGCRDGVECRAGAAGEDSERAGGAGGRGEVEGAGVSGVSAGEGGGGARAAGDWADGGEAGGAGEVSRGNDE